MIDIEALVERPKIRRSVSKIKQQPLPITTDEQIEAVTRRKIEDVRRKAEASFRSWLRLWHDPVHYVLLSVAAKKKYSNVQDIGHPVYAPVIGRAKSVKMQQIAFDVMKEYGLDEDFSISDLSMTSRGSGLATEWRVFPSTLYRGLQFSLARTYIEETGKNTDFAWHVSDGLAPLNNLGPVRIFDKRVESDLQAQAIIQRAGKIGKL